MSSARSSSLPPSSASRSEGKGAPEAPFVDFTEETVTEVGVLDSIFGPNGEIFFRTGFALLDLETGTTIARHGVLDVFDEGEFCAALS